MQKNLFSLLCAALLMGTMQMTAGNKFNIKEITDGDFRSETLDEVTPLKDGETYSQISADEKQIVTYSFRTGKQTKVLFDVDHANLSDGKKIEKV